MAPPASLGGPRLARALRWAVATVLVVAATLVLSYVYQFALTRFFTIDEYQWGHATWLVSEGKVPYRDFYEHHLPLGYIFHSLFLSDAASFTERALVLRKIGVAYIWVASTLTAVVTYVVQRDPFEALLSAVVPISVGFGLLSAIDYRGDNWSAFTLICCFSLLELNQLARRRWLAALAGVLFACAILMTQKIVVLGGFAIVLMLLPSFWQQVAAKRPSWLSRLEVQRIFHPTVFCIAAALPIGALLALGAWVGELGRAFQITFVQALQHEQLYSSFSAWNYVAPYIRYALVTTTVLVVGAVYHLAHGLGRFWTLPALAVILGGTRIAAPFPYNFVLASFLLGLCAVRGYCEAVRRAAQRWPVLRRASPLLYLFPLVLVPAQLGFVEGSTTNAEQLETLRRIEAHSTPEDVVIDSEGSALFRPHRSYYWYQGRAHAKMFEDYYRNDFVQDLRASQALFWIDGIRSKQLPRKALTYLREHYIPFRGDLFVLGFTFTNSSLHHPTESSFEVVRAGEYFLSLSDRSARRGDEAAATGLALRIDGQPVTAGSLHLDTGWHRASIDAGAPEYRLSYLPPSTFDTASGVDRHAPLFEYERPR